MWKLALIVPAILLAGPLAAIALGVVDVTRPWHVGHRNPAGLAPDPAATPETVIQVYAARTLGWRGAFGLHTWIAIKPRDAQEYTVYEVIGWRQYRGLPVFVAHNRAPDGYWFGNKPWIVSELRGASADAAMQRVLDAIASYPHKDNYRMWPGPNSNSFTAHVGRLVPELAMDLPATALGKDYLGLTTVFAPSPSGTGYQLSLFGALGVMAARREGLEVNFLGFTFGVDPSAPALKVPGLGRIGPAASS
ncbi:MAG: DUF3750 domain-containing protein [Alphaproteobacteria bacterium]|nr:DUF3750 domain-containing protein [Alphaproteobacteria bacterium]